MHYTYMVLERLIHAQGSRVIGDLCLGGVDKFI